MKKLILIIIALSFVSVCFAVSIQDMHKAVIARKNVAGGADYTENHTDTFSDSAGPPTGWTELTSSWTDNGSTLQRDVWNNNEYIIYSANQLSSVDHYVCIKIADFGALGTDNPGVVMRLNDLTPAAEEYYYIIRDSGDSNTLEFRACENYVASCETFHSEAFADLTDGQTICGAVEGTGASTIFYFWEDPLNGTIPPTKSDATYTINSGNWDGAPNTVGDNVWSDTGQYVGVANMVGDGGASTILDDFSTGVD